MYLFSICLINDQLVVQQVSTTVYSVINIQWMEYCTLFVNTTSVQLLPLEFISTSVASNPYTKRDYTSLTTLLTIMSHSPHNNFSVVHNCNFNSMSTLHSPIHSYFIMTITTYLLLLEYTVQVCTFLQIWLFH